MIQKDVVDRDVELLKVYNAGDTDVCVAMRDVEDRKCIDQLYPWGVAVSTVMPALESGIVLGRQLQDQPTPAGEKKPKPVVTIYVMNPKNEPDERCHLRINDAVKLLARMNDLRAARELQPQ